MKEDLILSYNEKIKELKAEVKPVNPLFKQTFDYMRNVHVITPLVEDLSKIKLYVEGVEQRPIFYNGSIQMTREFVEDFRDIIITYDGEVMKNKYNNEGHN